MIRLFDFRIYSSNVYVYILLYVYTRKERFLAYIRCVSLSNKCRNSFLPYEKVPFVIFRIWHFLCKREMNTNNLHKIRDDRFIDTTDTFDVVRVFFTVFIAETSARCTVWLAFFEFNILKVNNWKVTLCFHIVHSQYIENRSERVVFSYIYNAKTVYLARMVSCELVREITVVI